MFVALWEYEVKQGCQREFEKVYGRKGLWARLFRRDRNYRETRLLLDVGSSGLYVTLDFWRTRKAYEEFLAAHAAEYKKLDAVGEKLTVRERRMGWFEGGKVRSKE